MADDIELNAGSGGSTLAADDIAGVYYQRVKVTYGTDGNATDVSGSNPMPITGTVTANLSATDNAVLDSIYSAVSGTLTVGSHAVTNAGTFAVQATQSGTWTVNLGTTDNAVLDSIDSAVNGTLTVGSHAVTNAGTFAVQAAQSGTWNITNISGTVSLPTGAATAAKQPALGTAGTASSDVITVQGIASMTALTVDGSGVTQPVSGTVTANLSATDNAVLDVIETNTSPGASHYRNIDANAESEMKGSAGTLHWLHAMNLTNAKAYLHLYDATAASVTPGSTTPTFTFPLPTQGDTNGAGFALPLGPNGHDFANGITLVCTTTTDGSAGDPGTNGVMVNAGYT